MWWPALGGLVVGLVGVLDPHTMGVGYDNIENILGGGMAMHAVVILCALKFVSWSVSLGAAPPAAHSPPSSRSAVASAR